MLEHDLLARSEPTPWVRPIGLVDTTGGKYVVGSYRITYVMTYYLCHDIIRQLLSDRRCSRGDRKNRTCKSSRGGSGPRSNIRVPLRTHTLQRAQLYGCVERFLRRIPAGGFKRSQCGPWRRHAGLGRDYLDVQWFGAWVPTFPTTARAARASAR